MIHYKLLTPGPLTTTETVKRQMLEDHCTWDDDYKRITQKIRKELLHIAHASEENYTTVLMQGSGSFGVESVITSVVGAKQKVLIATNGAYGERMINMAEHAGISYEVYRVPYDQIPSAQEVKRMLEQDEAITHVIMVHSETTSGILNDIASVSRVVKDAGRVMIVDAMSSFGGVEIPVEELGIDFIISSANKCIQGVPGFSFIICNRRELYASEGKARSLSLDLFDQWKTMEKDGKWRFTSPTHTVLAFAKALEEFEEEGGTLARSARYYKNNRLLIHKMKALGIKPYIEEKYQGPIITTFLYPQHHDFSFEEMYTYIKARGYAIYPGKLTDVDTFRIGNIGEIYEEDIRKLADIFQDFFARKKTKKVVIFDWAGTAVDYGCFAPVKAFAKVFKNAGIETTMEEIREPMGMLKWDHIRTMLSMPRIHHLWVEKYGKKPEDADADRLYEEFEPSLLEILNQYVEPIPYVLDTVAALRERGIKIGSTTGYTDVMMKIVVEGAKQNGYTPDCWFSPDAVGSKGRPYPYMIYKNMEKLEISSVEDIVKVGDTISDIKEGKSAGVFTIGVLEGSSLIGISREEYEALDEEKKEKILTKATIKYEEAGADAVIRDMRGLLEYV